MQLQHVFPIQALFLALALFFPWLCFRLFVFVSDPGLRFGSSFVLDSRHTTNNSPDLLASFRQYRDFCVLEVPAAVSGCAPSILLAAYEYTLCALCALPPRVLIGFCSCPLSARCFVQSGLDKLDTSGVA